MYENLILPHLDYGCVVWDGLDKNLSTRVQKLQNRTARIMTLSGYDMRSTDILAILGWETIEKRRYDLENKLMTYRMNGKAPRYSEDLFMPKQTSAALLLRDSHNKLAVPLPKTDCFKQSFSYSWALTLEQRDRNWTLSSAILLSGYFVGSSTPGVLAFLSDTFLYWTLPHYVISIWLGIEN